MIEYKHPKGAGKITENKNAPGVKAVVKQIKKRFHDLQAEEHVGMERIFGVGCDGDTFVFVRMRGAKIDVEDPQPVTSYAVQRLLRAIVSLGARGLSFTPENLAAHFGSESKSAKDGVRLIHDLIHETDSPKAQTFFRQWQILFGEVCGYDIHGQSAKVRKLAEHYGVRDPNPAELLFAVHTYYAIFMKMLAAEIVASFSPLGTSTLKKLVSAPTSAKLRDELRNLEQGGIWSQLGIRNFLEGDLFSWYLDAWNEGCADAVRAMTQSLDQFDPTTLSVDPAESRDLLKQLYQQLFPKSVRHDLGEYYTPDWLAELVLDELGYDGNPDKRLLDPACGSGTFLVMALNRVKTWYDEHRHECAFGEDELLHKVLRNIIGFDLNPLAVMAARTNYLMAIRDLLRHAGHVELPVYLCDSIMTPDIAGRKDEQTTFLSDSGIVYNLENPPLALPTAAKTSLIPREIASSRGHLSYYAETVESCIRKQYSVEAFITLCTEEGLPISELEVHKELYLDLQALDAHNKNGVWARIIKNAFAPLFVGKVDFVAGNPPWVRWGYLPNDYRTQIKHLWRKYGLFTQKGLESRMGTAELDLSILFTYVCADAYLGSSAVLGFLITQEVIRSKGAGEGFRAFALKPDGTPLRVLRFHDLVAVKPFDAANKTSCILIRKGEKNVYPVEYIQWNKKPRQTVASSESLSAVMEKTRRTEYHASPLSGPLSPWKLSACDGDDPLFKLDGKSRYKGRCGVSIDPYAVFICRIIAVLNQGSVIVENNPSMGKTKVSRAVPTKIEYERVYPIVRGRDIRRWKALPEYAGIIINSSTRKGDIPSEVEIQTSLPLTYGYLFAMKQAAIQRAKFWQFFSREHLEGDLRCCRFDGHSNCLILSVRIERRRSESCRGRRAFGSIVSTVRS